MIKKILFLTIGLFFLIIGETLAVSINDLISLNKANSQKVTNFSADIDLSVNMMDQSLVRKGTLYFQNIGDLRKSRIELHDFKNEIIISENSVIKSMEIEGEKVDPTAKGSVQVNSNRETRGMPNEMFQEFYLDIQKYGSLTMAPSEGLYLITGISKGNTEKTAKKVFYLQPETGLMVKSVSYDKDNNLIATVNVTYQKFGDIWFYVKITNDVNILEVNKIIPVVLNFSNLSINPVWTIDYFKY